MQTLADAGLRKPFWHPFNSSEQSHRCDLEPFMDLKTIVTHVEQWTLTEVHELKAWLDQHVLHRASTAPEAPVTAPAAAEPGEHTDGA